MSSAVILLHPSDNVVVCRRNVLAGERLAIEGAEHVVARCDVEIGHKIARVDLAEASKVIKYGAPIGSITKHVQAGDWVHLHNMKSDYISAHLRDAVGEGT
jgi:hypothetical protein